MFTDNNLYLNQFEDLINGAAVQISTIKPSDWVEKNVIMGDPFPGPYRYGKTPYCRKIIDCLAPDHPARWIAWMKGLQVGASSGVILPGLAYIISQAPGNTYFTVGAPDLVDEAGVKLDLVIDRAGLRNYIVSPIQRKRNVLTGDKTYKKDFSGGYIKIASANNHKNWRDVSLKYGFFDDFEAVKQSSKESGDTRKLIEGRFAAYKDVHKIFYISTPELEEGSNILPAFNLGDREYYFINCPCCHEPIVIDWSIEEGQVINPLTNDVANGKGGIEFQLNNHGQVIDSSVGYVCYRCAGYFKDNNKDRLLNEADWMATALPSKAGYFSFHLSSLYAPSGMYDWKHYVNNYVEANPPGQPQKEAEHKTFVTTCLGRTYKPAAEAPKATAIMKNIRDYEIGTIPESLSERDGNGKIILLTCGADMNGTVEDARLDYEIVAWSESGASYSIKHGSIGTFIPRENTLKYKEDRERWTYEHPAYNNVWDEFDKVVGQEFLTDTGRRMMIHTTSLDCGNNGVYAYNFLDRTNNWVKGVRGEKEDRYVLRGMDMNICKSSAERPGVLFMLQVGVFKDRLSEYMNLKWNKGNEGQPANFMNFPQPGGGLYGFENFFEHFESENRTLVTDKNGQVFYRWVKKNAAAQNHLFDCRIYNLAAKEIIIKETAKAFPQIKDFQWRDYVDVVFGRLKAA